MLLSHAHQFIYTKTVKTAGTSVEIYFEDACLPDVTNIERGHWISETVTATGVIGCRGAVPPGANWYNHMSAEAIRANVGERIWSRYFKFCVVRNPFDKLVSRWWMQVPAATRDLYRDADFDTIRNDFICWSKMGIGTLIDRDKYLIGDQPCMDYFIRYENLLEGIRTVCAAIDYPFDPSHLGNYKSDFRSDKTHYSRYYDRATREAVRSAFRWELDYFGYEFEDAASEFECVAPPPPG